MTLKEHPQLKYKDLTSVFLNSWLQLLLINQVMKEGETQKTQKSPNKNDLSLLLSILQLQKQNIHNETLRVCHVLSQLSFQTCIQPSEQGQRPLSIQLLSDYTTQFLYDSAENPAN